jgi:hypothetical protein
MIIRRSNLKSDAVPRSVAQGAPGLLQAQRTAADARLPCSGSPPNGGGRPPVGPRPPVPGDIIYGARAIARFLFDDDSTCARRRVFNLWAHYRDRQEPTGLFKLKGALCLSKSQWLKFHGFE